MTIIIFLHLFTFICVLGLGIFVVYKKPTHEASWYFGLFALGTALWNLSLFLAINHLGQPTILGRLAISFGAFMPAGFFLFLSSFPRRDSSFVVQRAIVILLAIFFCGISLSPLVVKEAWIINDAYLGGTFGKLYLFFWIYYLAFLSSAFIKCFSKYHTTKTISERNQLRYITLGFLSFFLPLLITQFILPLCKIFNYNNLGPLFSLPMIVIISYAIIRHHVMDIRIIIQRSLIYTILIVSIVLVYLCGITITEYLFHESPYITNMLVSLIVTILGIFGLPLLTSLFKKWSNPIFFKHTYNYKEALHRLSRILYTCLRRDDIANASEKILKEIFQAESVTLSLNPTYTPIQHTHPGFLTLTLPVIFENEILGILFMGTKRSEDPYTEEDMQLLKTYSYQAAIALEKARLYEKVEQYNLNLEQIVSKRTKEIQELQEEQKQTMIDISHNLQTPIAIIKGELELLHESSANPQKMRTVARSLDRVSDFIRQLLRLSKLDHKSFEVPLETINLSRLIHDHVDYFEVMAEAASVKILTSLSKNVLVYGNKKLLEELLMNLVANAIYYHRPKTESVVRISLKRYDKEIRICVEDNGIGISDEDCHKIFTRFYRTTQRTPTSHGSGLGLAICKKIVDKHQGRISVRSQLGVGTTFTIFLPKNLPPLTK